MADVAFSPFQELAASGLSVSRDPGGRFAEGNTAALRTGCFSRQLQDDAAPWREQQIAAIRADLGNDIATLKAHTIEQLGTLLVVLRFLSANLMAEGPLTGKGRQRAATSAYLQVLDRYVRLAQTIGLDRQTRQLPNPADWLEGKA